MSSIIAYIGLGLLIIKGIAPFFSSIHRGCKEEEIDEVLGFRK